MSFQIPMVSKGDYIPQVLDPSAITETDYRYVIDPSIFFNDGHENPKVLTTADLKIEAGIKEAYDQILFYVPTTIFPHAKNAEPNTIQNPLKIIISPDAVNRFKLNTNDVFNAESWEFELDDSISSTNARLNSDDYNFSETTIIPFSFMIISGRSLDVVISRFVRNTSSSSREIIDSGYLYNDFIDTSLFNPTAITATSPSFNNFTKNSSVKWGYPSGGSYKLKNVGSLNIQDPVNSNPNNNISPFTNCNILVLHSKQLQFYYPEKPDFSEGGSYINFESHDLTEDGIMFNPNSSIFTGIFGGHVTQNSGLYVSTIFNNRHLLEVLYNQRTRRGFYYINLFLPENYIWWLCENDFKWVYPSEIFYINVYGYGMHNHVYKMIPLKYFHVFGNEMLKNTYCYEYYQKNGEFPTL